MRFVAKSWKQRAQCLMVRCRYGSTFGVQQAHDNTRTALQERRDAWEQGRLYLSFEVFGVVFVLFIFVLFILLLGDKSGLASLGFPFRHIQ